MATLTVKKHAELAQWVDSGAIKIHVGQCVLGGKLSSVIKEGLTILAWVALWRPGELLLYERYPFQRDARLFSKLERAEFQVIPEVHDTMR